MKTLEPMPQTEIEVLDCKGYRSLLEAVKADAKNNHHDYWGKLKWVVARAKHYAEKTGLSAESILDAWEERRNYWYMNYYQDCNQPEIKGDNVRVFETVEDLLASIGKPEFRCPKCQGVSKSPYECSVAPCDWKSWGLLGTLGKGVSVFVKEKLKIENIFMPVAWEVER